MPQESHPRAPKKLQGEPRELRFGEYRLDVSAGRLYASGDAERVVALTPRAFDLLIHLARHPGKLLSKEHLLDVVWEGASVTEGVLKVAIRELRKALGDDARAPRFIETAYRKGYRFVALPEPEARRAERAADVPAASPVLPTVIPIGRSSELEQLGRAWRSALLGRRQIVFVTGEAGIGKTCLLDAFRSTLPAQPEAWVARGHCLEHFGAGEPYLPLFDAFGRLSRTSAGDSMAAILRRFAPTWLLQMPSLLEEGEREVLRRESVGATPHRMLREISEALEALSAEVPVALLLEDLHWSDHSTVDAVSFIARRSDPARLLLVLSYRKNEVAHAGHPLGRVRQSLETRRQCRGLDLAPFDEAAVGDFLVRRFPGIDIDPGVTKALSQRTGGNPLFLTLLAEDLESRDPPTREGGRWRLLGTPGLLGEDLPDEIRELILARLERLGEREMLEVAAVAGAEFTASTLAVGLGAEPLEVEERCEGLVRRALLAPLGVESLAGNRLTARYAFAHVLYQQALYEQVPAARMARLHRAIAIAREDELGERADLWAAELALHYERARDWRKAVHFLRQAARTATRRMANREAVDHLSRALELAEVTDSRGMTERCELLKERGLVRRAMGDVDGAVEDFEALVGWARANSQRAWEAQGLLYLVSVLWFRREQRCMALVQEARELAEELEDPLARTHFKGYCGHWNINLRGWRARDAEDFRHALAAARRADDREQLGLHLVRDVYLRCLEGDYRGAQKAGEEGMALALEIGDPFDYFLCLFFRTWAQLHGGLWRGLRRMLRRGIEMAEKNGHETWALLLRIALAWRYEQALDFERAQNLCAPALHRAREGHGETGQLLFKSLIVQGWVHLGLGRNRSASSCFSEVESVTRGPHAPLDSILYLPLKHGLGLTYLAQGRLPEARREAELLGGLASGPGERSYLASAARLLLEAALLDGDPSQGDEVLERFRSHLEGRLPAPALWRSQAVVAELHEAQGRAEEANAAWERSAEALGVLAEELADEPPLQRSFLGRPAVCRVLDRAARPASVRDGESG